MEDDRKAMELFIAPELAKGLGQSQGGNNGTQGDTGCAGAEANAMAERLGVNEVGVSGMRHEQAGAARRVDSVSTQTKYFSSAASTVENAFDGITGAFRYEGQQLEVPKDQYEDCIRIMREKISDGKVPGVTDPGEAERVIRMGDVTYKQARNIARAGNIDALLFDATTQSITMGYVFAITFAVHFAKRKWRGDKTENAIHGAIESAIAAGGATLITGLIATQVLRTKSATLASVAALNSVKAVSTTAIGRITIERLAQASLGQAVYGAAAINRVANLLRSNVITSVIATAVTSTPDFCRAAFFRRISWPQFTKNLVVNAGGVAAGAGGWMGGAAAGAALGSAVPGIGTAVCSVIGGILGASGGGWLGSTTTKGVMDTLVEDDAKHMVDVLQAALEELSNDYFLSEAEIAELGQTIKTIVNSKWLRSMYQVGAEADSDTSRSLFAYNAFDLTCQTIVAKRQRVFLPPTEQVQAQIDCIAATVAAMEDLPEAAVTALAK